MIDDRLPAFGTHTLDELMRLSWSDLDQLEALDGDPEGLAMWWELRRREWRAEDAG